MAGVNEVGGGTVRREGFSSLRRLVREAGGIGAARARGMAGAVSAPGVLDLASVLGSAKVPDSAEALGATGITGAAGARIQAGLPSMPNRAPAPAAGEICELCSEPIPSEHRHLFEQEQRTLLCICRGCSILFDRREAGGARYRLVPDRILALVGFQLDDLLWERFDLPVELAFFQRQAGADQVTVYYPGALGAAESRLAVELWGELVSSNPVLGGLEPEVEALLVSRVGGAREYWIAPLDLCYALVGVIRQHWKGLGGGEEVWGEVARFSDNLRRQAVNVDRHGARTTASAGVS